MPHDDRRQERHDLLDQALAPFSRASVLTLLRAALESPGCARFHDHLLLAWARTLSAPARAGRVAAAGDLPVMVHAALQAAPGLGVMTERLPNTPGAAVSFVVGGRRFLVHPGEFDHPLLVLCSLQDVADAVDEYLLPVRGFGIGDVLELVLRHTDHTVAGLAPAWPDADQAEREPRQITCQVSEAEVVAAAELGVDHLATAGVGGQEQTAATPAYLTRGLDELALTHNPGLPALGPTLLVSDGESVVPVPASTAIEAVTAAAADLLHAHPAPAEAQMRLRRSTLARVARLLGLDHVPTRPGEVCRISSPPHRLEIAIIATLGEDLAALVERARAELSTARAGAGRLIVYSGPPVTGAGSHHRHPLRPS